MLLVKCTFFLVLFQMRKIRTLTELIVEAEDVVSNPTLNKKVSAAQSSLRWLVVNVKLGGARQYFKCHQGHCGSLQICKTIMKHTYTYLQKRLLARPVQ